MFPVTSCWGIITFCWKILRVSVAVYVYVCIYVCIMCTCKDTNIDVYIWLSLLMAEGKVSSWIVLVNAIMSTCCFVFIYVIVLGNLYLLLLILMIRAIPSHYFALTFVDKVSFLTECLMMSSIITCLNKPNDGRRLFIFSGSYFDRN